MAWYEHRDGSDGVDLGLGKREIVGVFGTGSLEMGMFELSLNTRVASLQG